MKARDFCYWLQGYFELAEREQSKSLNAEQITCIEKHLEMVFAHDIDPDAGDDKHQDVLNKIHHDNSGVKLRC